MGQSCVLMGDIVRSETSLPPDELHRRFNRVIEAANAEFRDRLRSPLTITLGDEFQGLLDDLAPGLELLRWLRLALLDEGIGCRFVLGRVEIRTPVNAERAWNMMGPGLARARETLDDKKPGQLYRFSLPDAPLIEQMLEALGAGLSLIETRWTDRQRRDITALLEGSSPAELAERRGVSVHSIYKVRASGHYETYRMQWQAIAAALESLDRQEGDAA